MDRQHRQKLLNQHVADLLQCRRCPQMKSTPVSGGAIVSDIVVVGQAPGPREPILQRQFAHTAGKTLFHWFDVIPLPNPSGASPWHKISPGRELTKRALKLIARHPAMAALCNSDGRSETAATAA